MNEMVVTGWSALSSAGPGADSLAGAGVTAPEARPGTDIGHLFPEALPAPRGCAVDGFDVRAQLGRKGVSTYDRGTALAVVCCRDAMRAAGMALEGTPEARVGVALGTNLGAFQASCDFDRETLIHAKPYQVNPLLFPATLMNYAAGQVAMRFGLHSVNMTVAGGILAFLSTLRYAATVLRRGHTDAILAGAVEEYSPHRAWARHLTGGTARIPLGEAAAVFVLTGPQAPDWAGPDHIARILAVTTGYGPGGAERADQALADCVRRALRQAGADPSMISVVLTGETADADVSEYEPVARALGCEPPRLLVKPGLGECDGASSALALAMLLAAPDGDLATGGLGLITARSADGAVGAAIVRRTPRCQP